MHALCDDERVLLNCENSDIDNACRAVSKAATCEIARLVRRCRHQGSKAASTSVEISFGASMVRRGIGKRGHHYQLQRSQGHTKTFVESCITSVSRQRRYGHDSVLLYSVCIVST